MHRWKLLAIVAAVAAVGSASAVAGSSHFDSVYTGCLKDGDLHSVAVGQQPLVPCKEKETEVTLQGDVSGALSSLASDMAAQIDSLEIQIGDLHAQLDGLEDTVLGLQDQLTTETAARLQADEELEQFAELLRVNLIVEGQTRAAGDQALSDAIGQEEADRAAADDALHLALGKETTDRVERDAQIVELMLDTDRFYRRTWSADELGGQQAVSFTVSCRPGDVAIAPVWDAEWHLIENLSFPNAVLPNPGAESWTIELTYSALDDPARVGVLCYDMTP